MYCTKSNTLRDEEEPQTKIASIAGRSGFILLLSQSIEAISLYRRKASFIAISALHTAQQYTHLLVSASRKRERGRTGLYNEK
jgi:hypothetical protein